MEFREYSNPEEADYDLRSSYKDEEASNSPNSYVMELCNMIGILEDIDDASLMEMYGITVNEYLRPTKETIEKVRKRLEKSSEEEHHFKM